MISCSVCKVFDSLPCVIRIDQIDDGVVLDFRFVLPDAGRDGYYTMTDRWFDEYTYQIVVNRKYLPKEVLEAYEQEPIVLKPWDPMGSLA